MDAAGIAYRRQGNCFTQIEDYRRAQELADAQLRVNWAERLDGIAGQLNPIHPELFDKFRVRYYWSVYQSEWATDVVFRERAELQRLYPMLVRHAMNNLGTPDVMRFLGRRVAEGSPVPARFAGEVISDVRHREEGVRIKHWLNENSVKAYDKAYTSEGSVLRLETTVNNVADFRVYRSAEGDPEGRRNWRPLRKGIADLHRRAEVSQKANERYLEAMAAVDDSTRLEELTRRLERRAFWSGKSVRPLHPFDADDQALLAAIGRGEFVINGLRNRDLQALLFAHPARSESERRRRSAMVSRKLRLLRGHRLLRKVPRSHRYHLTAFGRQAVTAILAAANVPVSHLCQKAA